MTKGPGSARAGDFETLIHLGSGSAASTKRFPSASESAGQSAWAIKRSSVRMPSRDRIDSR
jgi:hypothetical protein